MNIHFGIKALSLTAILALTGCMTNEEPTRGSNADKLKFASLTTEIAARNAQISADPTDPEAFADQLREFGCNALADVFVDISKNTSDELPASVQKQLGCFGISGTGTIDDVDPIMEKLQDFTTLLDCICGGTALSSAYERLKMTGFSGELSAAASSSFDGKSAAASSSFDGKSSAAGSSFDGKSSAAASGFGD
jgi:hypothetical protein